MLTSDHTTEENENYGKYMASWVFFPWLKYVKYPVIFYAKILIFWQNVKYAYF
jgi:hypothetical protein